MLHDVQQLAVRIHHHFNSNSVIQFLHPTILAHPPAQQKPPGGKFCFQAFGCIHEALEEGPGVPAIICRWTKDESATLLLTEGREIHTTITLWEIATRIKGIGIEM